MVYLTSAGCSEYQADYMLYRYNSSGQLQYLQGRTGIRWTVTQDSGGKVRRVTDPFLRLTSFAYDGSNNIRRVQDPAGRITSFVVNSSANLARVQMPDGTISSMAYDSGHHLRSWTNPLGDRSTVTYDSSSRVTAVWQPLGQRSSFSYGSNVTGLTNALVKRVTQTFNASSSILNYATNVAAQRTSYTWSSSTLNKVTNALSQQTSTKMAAVANVRATTLPAAEYHHGAGEPLDDDVHQSKRPPTATGHRRGPPGKHDHAPLGRTQ